MGKKIEIKDEEVDVVHPLAASGEDLSMRGAVIIVILVVLVGVLTGFLLSLGKNITTSSLLSVKKNNSDSEVKKTIGIKDKKTFKDNSEGILQEGGIEDEGQFHLSRPGGSSQNVYLTSSAVDLSEFIGKKVRVWGETFSAEKAGWLMDVGLVEVL